MCDFLEADILNIANYSLQTGVFPAACKTALVPAGNPNHLS